MSSNKNHYKVLGISIDATQQDIKKAYHQLALKFHPDKNPDPSAAEEFKKIGEAYATLSDKTQRIAYDFTLHDEDDDEDIDPPGPSYLDQVRASYENANLPESMQANIIALAKAAQDFDEKNFHLSILSDNASALTLAYIKGIIQACKDHPARRAILEQGIQLTTNAFNNPTDENIQQCKNHVDQIPATASLEIKKIGGAILVVATSITVLRGITETMYGILALNLSSFGSGMFFLIASLAPATAAVVAGLSIFDERRTDPKIKHGQLADHIEYKNRKP